MKLRERPKSVMRLEKAEVDWEHTVAWGWGGYYARIFINVKGRESRGAVEPREYEDVREQLKRDLEKIKGPRGESWDTKVYRPEELYPVCNGNPPDLIAYLDDLYWRSAGTIGHDILYLPENDLGPDDAVHDYDGIFILYDRKSEACGRRDVSIYDVAPTVLKLMGLPVLKYMEGEALEEV